MRPFSTSYLPVAALILSGSALLAAPTGVPVGSPVVQTESTQASAHANELLKEIRSIATELSREAATLESYKLGRLSWQSHAYQLTLSKGHLNAIGERLEKLQAIRDSAAPWQKQAISALVPLAQQLASRTEDAIKHLNGNHHQLFASPYTDHLTTIAASSDDIRQTASLFLELARTQERLDDLLGRIVDIES
jgi:hypothetical protein